MILGSLFDLGVPPAEIEQALRPLDLEPWDLVVEEVKRGPLRAIWCDVRVTGKAHAHRHLADIERLITAAGLPLAAGEAALRTFRLIAAAEGHVHGTAPEKVAFHEVGAVDSIVDILGTCCAVDWLGATRITCSAIPLGQGTVSSMHGTIPVPSPATCALLKGVPIRQTDSQHELTTPTGAALMVALAEQFGPAPAMVLENVGYGAGCDRATPVPNVLRVFRGSGAHGAEHLLVLETNIDNVSAEAIGYLVGALLEAGAPDAFLTPLTMKKTRQAQMLSVLCRPDQQPELEELIFRNIPTLGIRSHPVSRHVLDRRHVEVPTPWGTIRIKEAVRGDEILHAWPEYEDLKAAAASHHLGIASLRERIMEAYRREREEDAR
jgi:uncharacterized protein (TIGR00299 family) protein